MKRWFLRSHTNSISLINQGEKPDSSFLGDFFDSWEQAHERLVKRNEQRVASVKLQLERAVKSLEKARKMKRADKEE